MSGGRRCLMAEQASRRRLAGELSAEFLGTMVLILFGCGVVAQVVAAGIGDHDSIAWAWGFGVTLGVYIAARLSGAHRSEERRVGKGCECRGAAVQGNGKKNRGRRQVT